MCARSKTLFISALFIGLLACGTTAFLVARAAGSDAEERRSGSEQVLNQAEPGPRTKNLLLQPEAFKLARRLGARFSPGKSRTTVVAGTLTLGSEAHMMQLTRTQTDDGENVQIAIADSDILTWDASRGGLSTGRQVTAGEQELIERLVLDSPDQFVLMQLRGASYTTVARGVRPTGATEGYSGPLWTIVRVDERQQEEVKRPASLWRLYYLNTMTGLIDRIESEVEGKRVVAEISWTEADGEKVPARIVWTRAGKALMQYSLTGFSVSQN